MKISKTAVSVALASLFAANVAFAMPGFTQAKRVADLLESRVQQQRLGRKTGAGFYDYPNPEFESPAFLGEEAGDVQLGSTHQRFVPVEAAVPVAPSLHHEPRITGPVLLLGTVAVRRFGLAVGLGLHGAPLRGGCG